jgi:Peroxidase, family 2
MSASSSDHATTSPNGWHRPQPGEHRSPCPALNSLANSGYIPRDGRPTSEQLVRAMETYLGLSPRIGKLLADAAIGRLGKPGPLGQRVLDLADLSLHGFIEHDASLTRRDAHAGDHAEFVEPLFEQLLSFSSDGRTLKLDDLAVAHQMRVAQSEAEGQHVSLKAKVLGTAEAALLFAVLSRDGVIAIPDLEEFLRKERVPSHLTPGKVDQPLLLGNVLILAITGNVPGFEAHRRAQKAIEALGSSGAARCPVAHTGGSAQAS